MFLRSSKNVSTEKIKPIETGSGCQACSKRKRALTRLAGPETQRLFLEVREER